MLLFINACVRAASRTKRIADHLINRLGGTVEEVKTAQLAFPVTDEGFLQQRDAYIARGEFDAPCFAPARQFASADEIVIAAPYWDLSFPAALKQYFEQINVVGLTFEYTPEGVPIGLCRAKRLFYVTTAGGPIFSDEYGFGYVRALAEGFYNIPEVREIKAEGLDVYGADVESILRRAEAQADALTAI